MLDELALDLLEDGGEEPALAVEVVIERSPRDAGGGDDLLRADRVVAAGREELAAGGDQRRPRRLAALRLGPSSGSRLTYIQCVC